MCDVLKDSEELLFRQIRSRHFDSEKDEPTSEAFQTLKQDCGKLSVDRSTIFTPKQSFDNFLKNGFDSVAVYGLTVGDFAKEGVKCFADPIKGKNPAHAVADYAAILSVSKNQMLKMASRLKEIAIAHGKLHP